jgi:hypothetical protein
MATISTLAVNLIARTSLFEKGMRRSKTSVKSLKSTITGAVGTLARFAKGLVIAAGIGGMGFLLKRTMQTIDATAKLSDRIGITTEALVGLQHAANIAGVSTESLNKALEIFTRRMGEVKAGSGEAKRGLEALGLSAERMIKLTPEQSMGVIADRINELGTQAEKSAAAYFLFGRSGAQLLNLFEKGAEGIAAAQIEVEKLGLTFSRLDAAKVEEANDAITRLKGAMQGLVNTATIRLAPSIKKLTNFFLEHRNAVVITTKNIIVFAAKLFIVSKAISFAVGTVRVLIAAYKALATAQIIVKALSGPKGWVVLAAGIAIATGAIVGLNDVMKSAIKNIKEVQTGTDEISKEAGAAQTRADAAQRLQKIQRSIVFWQDKLVKNVGIEAAKRDVVLNKMKKEAAGLRQQLFLLDKQKKIRLADRDAAKKRKAAIEKEAEILSGVNKFIVGLEEDKATAGFTSEEKRLFQLQKTGQGLSGSGLDRFNAGLDRASELIRQSKQDDKTSSQATFTVLQKIASNTSEDRRTF